MNFYDRQLSKLPNNLPLELKYFNSFDCCLTSLNGSPNKIEQGFSCAGNKLSNLIGSPKYVGFTFECSNNKLTSLNGLSKFIGRCLWGIFNSSLLDVSDIWESEILGTVYLSLIKQMAILPLIKFAVEFEPAVRSIIIDSLPAAFYFQMDDILDIHKKHRGSSKQNIIDFQYDLVDNGFGDFAKWKP